MPIPFLFPIAGLVVSGVGVSMIVTYIRAEKETRSALDRWATDAAKTAVKAYLKLRYGIDLGSLTVAEEREYWQQFGARIDGFWAIAEPIALELYLRPFAQLTPTEQAVVARRVASRTGEKIADPGKQDADSRC